MAHDSHWHSHSSGDRATALGTRIQVALAEGHTRHTRLTNTWYAQSTQKPEPAHTHLLFNQLRHVYFRFTTLGSGNIPSQTEKRIPGKSTNTKNPIR